MIHIILVILKLLGLLIAFVLLLILFILLLLLFVPIRYRLKASYTEEQKYGQGQITWLFHLLSIGIHYNPGEKPKIAAKIFGCTIYPQTVKEELKKETSAKQTSEEKQEAIPKTIPEKPIEKPKETPKEMPEEKTFKPEQEVIEKPPIKKGIFTKIREIQEKIENIRQKIKDKIRSFIQKLTHIRQMFDHYYSIIKEDQTKALFRSVWGDLFYILKHYVPRKIKGYVRYGLKDPALTGQITGLLYMLRPHVMNEMNLDPVFETEKTVIFLETDMKGHVRLIHVLYIGLKLLFDKNLKHVLKRIKK